MRDLCEVYGEPYLKFALNCTDIHSIGEAPTENQKKVIDILTEISQKKAGEDDQIFRLNVAGRIGSYIAEIGTTVCSAMHQWSGGTLPAIETEDALLGHLLALGSQVWPVFLLPHPEAWPPYFGSLTSCVFSHPTTALLWQAIADDSELRKLFPDVPDQIGDDQSALRISSEIIFSTGHGETLQLAVLPETLLTAAWWRQILHGGGDLNSYLDELAEVLRETRILASGKEVQAPYLIGLENIRLPPESSIKLPFGVIRPARDTDQKIVHSSEHGPHAVNEDAIIESVHPLKILSVSKIRENLDDQWISHWEGFQAKFDEYADRGELLVTVARLSLLLASEGSKLIAPSIVARVSFNPLSSHLIQTWKTQLGAPSGVSVPDAAALQRAADWASKIRHEDVKRLRIGVRRILSAASDRVDPLDGLIDSVVCWENMFGSNTESTFRICGAMACLLVPDNREARANTMGKLKEIYSLRSKIVHGVRELRPREAMQYRDSAIHYGIEALRQLLDDSSLMDIKDSAVRGEKILLFAGYSYG